MARGMHHGEGVRKTGRLTAIKQRPRYHYGFQPGDDTPTFREVMTFVGVLALIAAFVLLLLWITS